MFIASGRLSILCIRSAPERFHHSFVTEPEQIIFPNLFSGYGNTFYQLIQGCLDTCFIISLQLTLSYLLTKSLGRIPVLAADDLNYTISGLLRQSCNSDIGRNLLGTSNVDIGRSDLSLCETYCLVVFVGDPVSQQSCPTCICRILVNTYQLEACCGTLLDLLVTTGIGRKLGSCVAITKSGLS